jgi:hypothetical protein
VHYVYNGGDQASTVELYKVVLGGHAWPSIVPTGGTFNAFGAPMSVGSRNMDFNACKEIWRFFSQHTLSTSLLSGIPENNVKQNNLSVYPNPSSGKFIIEVENYQNAGIKVVNLIGQPIYEGKLSNKITELDLRTIPSGIYFYSVKSQFGDVSSGKVFIK